MKIRKKVKICNYWLRKLGYTVSTVPYHKPILQGDII